MSGSELGENPWWIAAQVLRGAGWRVRALAACALVYFAGVAAWISLAYGWSAWLLPQMWGGMAAGIAGLLLGSAYGLFSVAQDGVWGSRWRWRLPARTLNRMFLALPAMVFLSAVLAAATGAALVPLALASPAYWVWVAACGAIVVASWRAAGDAARFLYGQAREQAAAAERANTRAADAQLAALQAQMNPHFLFNALNTVASLIRTDPRAAEATVEDLARVLRRTLDHSRSVTTPLEEELDFVRAYLGIEEARFGERLRVEWHVDPAALRLAVPPMTLQPLVENAIRHGIGGRLEGGRVRIAARREGDRLLLRVEDDGAGFAPGREERTGLGNLRERLATLYGGGAALRVEAAAPGTAVSVELPAGGER